MNRSADPQIGSIPILIRNQPMRRSALRVVQGFNAQTWDWRILSPLEGEGSSEERARYMGRFPQAGRTRSSEHRSLYFLSPQWGEGRVRGENVAGRSDSRM